MAKEVVLNIKVNSNGVQEMGQLKIAAKDLQAAVASVSKNIKGSFSSVSASVANISVATQGLSAAIQGLAGPSLVFDQAMRAANTMAGKGAKDFELLKEQVKALSKEVPVAREELANGLYQVISNGVPEDNWMAFLEQSARSSIGGIADLGEVVKVTSTVIKNYGLGWEDAGHIQDMIQLTAKNGVTSFEQLAQALPRVTTNAAKLGISTEELMATFSTLTGVTGNTNEVSTQLAAVLTALVKPSSEAQKMAKAMGIEFNAASIKGAGGLQNFLTTLDQTVQKYASANNVLADEVYGKLFGSAESLRALGALTGQLSDKYQENVAAMQDASGTIEAAFEEMAGSTQSGWQMMSNTFANLVDSISSLAAKYLPAIQFTAYMATATAGLNAVVKGVKTPFLVLDRVVRLTTVGYKMHIVTVKSASSFYAWLPKKLTKVISTVVGFGNATKGATMAVRGLSVAIKGLMAASVIGVILVAIGVAMEYFVNKTSEASDALDESKKEFEDWKKSLTDISQATGEIAAKEITALDALYKAATDETKSRRERVRAANELKNTYKDAFGNLETEAILAGQAAKAYDNLRESIIATATAEAAKAQIQDNKSQYIALDRQEKATKRLIEAKQREVEIANEEYNLKKKTAVDDATTRATSQGSMTSVPGSASTAYTSSVSWGYTPSLEAAEKAQKNAESRQNELNKLNSQLEDIENRKAEVLNAIDELYSYIPENTIDTTNSYNDLSDTLKDSDKTYKQQLEAKLATAKDRYVKASIAGNDAEAASIKLVIDSLRQQLAQIDLVEKKAERPATLTSLEDINAEIQYQQMLRSKASKENIAAIDAEIERLEKERIAMEYAQEPNIDKIKTYRDLEKAQQYYQQKMQYASEAERIEIQKIINQLEELKEKWDESLAGLKAPGDLASLDTLDKLSTALSYYQAQLEKASPDEIPGLVKMMEGIKEAQVLAQRPVTIATARYETDSISGLDKKTKKQKIRAIGYDELTDKIAALQAMLDDTEHPLLESQRNEVKELIEIYSQWQKSSVDTWGAVTQGISASASMLSNLGGAVKGAAAEWLSSIGQIMESLAKLIPLLLTVTGIKAMESAAETPIVGWMLVGAAAAAVIAAVASLPKFADGGIAYGPTLGMFGEYAGASNNPEVVAPLSKLRTLIEPAGFDAGKVEFEIDGTKLKGVLKRVEKRSSRS